MMTAQAPQIVRIAVLPPDERPNTGGYAAWIGACSGAEILLPPTELMPRFREPVDRVGLAAWLREIDHDVDAHVLSLDLLVHGGLIPSRLTDDRIAEVIPRLSVLQELRAPVIAYQVITRLPHYDNATRSRQEPEYWASNGRRMYALSQAWDRHARGEADENEARFARDAVSTEHVNDLVRRRLRNHSVNLAALELAADGVVRDLVITSDDTAPRGLPAAERLTLSTWNERLGAGALLYPGADEVPSVLVARVIARAHGIVPRIFVASPDAAGLKRIAPYEDRPIDEGISQQILALGAERVDAASEADLVLVIHAPAEEAGDFTGEPIAQDSAAPSAAVAREARAHLDAGRRVAVADVRYANGSDPVLVTALDAEGALGELVSYGGWNTAGNTLGTTLAAGVSALFDDTAVGADARRRYLLTKIVKDGHYLPVLRVRLLEELAERGLTDPPMDELPALAERVARDLTAWAQSIHALRGVRVVNVRWPWSYLFTVDFDLEVDDLDQP